MAGATSSTPKTTQEVFQDYQLLGVEDNHRVGDASLYKHKRTGELFLVKEIVIEDNSAEKHFDLYLESGAYKNKLFLTREVYKIGSKESFLCSANCAANLKIIVLMDFIERDLEFEIAQRAQEVEKDYFPEAEVWYIIEAVMNVEGVVLRQNRFHGDLRTSTIFITDDGFAKFLDPSLLDYRSNSFFKVMMGSAKCNLAPEYIQALQANQKEPRSNPELADVFSLGIVILSICCLQEDTYFYNWKRNELESKKVTDCLKEVQKRFSPLLHELVSGCLRENPQERISISDILGFIENRKLKKNDESHIQI